MRPHISRPPHSYDRKEKIRSPKTPQGGSQKTVLLPVIETGAPSDRTRRQESGCEGDEMGSGNAPASRQLGLTRRFRVCLPDNQGGNALGAFNARFCRFLGVVTLAFEAGFFGLWHVFIIGSFREKARLNFIRPNLLSHVQGPLHAIPRLPFCT